MYTLKVQNDRSELLNISADSNYAVLEINGLSPMPAEISTTAAVGYDGSIYTNGRCDKRNITMTIAIRGEVEESRQTLYSYFTPKRTVRLFFKNTNRDVYIDAYVETVEIDLFSQMQVANISLICPMPYFIWNHNSEYPVTTVDNNRLTATISGGDTESGIIVDFSLYAPSGAYSPIVIENQTYGEKITINTDVYRGDFHIDTNPGSKQALYTSVGTGVSENIINTLDIYKRKWITIHRGYNLLSIYIPGRTLSIADAITAKITAYTYFIGV